MRAIVKVFVVWTLGLAVLVGPSAVSLALEKPPTLDPSSCVQTSPDRWLCKCEGKKDCICTSPTPQGCGYKPAPLLGTTPARPQPLGVQPIAPAGTQIQTK